MNANAIVAAIASKSAAKEEPGDYLQDGLLYCGHCRTPKQCRLKIGDQARIVGCMCACQTREYEALRAAERDREERLRLRKLRAECVQDRQLELCVFEAAQDSRNIRWCREYVEQWPEMLKVNEGLLFYGDTGSGKTFAAACIANALLAKGVPVMVTSLPRIINAGWDKSEIIANLHRYPLMVLDDLGAERDSEYALETVYTVIDERYKSGKPMIVTTNLSLQELKNPKNMAYQRIYSRVLQMCVPVYFEPQGYRKAEAADKLRLAREIFGGVK